MTTTNSALRSKRADLDGAVVLDIFWNWIEAIEAKDLRSAIEAQRELMVDHGITLRLIHSFPRAEILR